MEFSDTQEATSLPIEQLLPARCLTVVLQFTGASHPKFFHQASLSAFVRHLLREPDDFDTLIRIESHESGRTDFGPGDRYVFRLFGLHGSEGLFSELIACLKDLPDSALRRERRICFRDNLRLLELRDGITDQAISTLEDLSVFTADDLLATAKTWQAQSPNEVQVSFASPVRLLKDKLERINSRGEARYCHDSKDLSSDLLINRIRDSFADLLRRRGATSLPPRTAPPALETQKHDLFWLESIYSDPSAHDRGMGGLCGTMTLTAPEGLPMDWWKLLVLGQFTGIGQRTSQGWGRFVLGNRDNNPNTWLQNCLTHGPLDQIIGEQNLLSSYYHCLFEQDELSKLGELRNAAPDAESLNDPVRQLRSHFEKLLNGSAELAPATLFEPNRSGLEIAIPAFEDRVLQQAIAQTLMPRLMLLRSSHFKGGINQAQDQLGTLALHKRISDENGFAAACERAKKISAKKVRTHLAALFGEDPLFNYVEASLRSEEGGINICSPLSNLIGPPMGMPAATETAWSEEPRVNKPHFNSRRPEVRVRSRSSNYKRQHHG
ncbi:MAG: hypothetical protein ACPGSC_02310 [Granulosicoccaceae bacterium]